MDAQGPNMSKQWNLEFGNRLLGIIREERNTTMYKFTIEFASGEVEEKDVSERTFDYEIQYLNQQKNALHKAGEDFIVDFSYEEIEG